jgi:radical SAM superfamily enzyme YgiQ (UPF0313 family)
MKILLLSPVQNPDARIPKAVRIPQVSLDLLKALTPAEHDVRIVEEETEAINLDEDCDLVGISCLTASAPRAYEMAAEFRRRGKKVVIGGIHPTILPDEAAWHADSVVVGEAESIWATVLEDAAKGTLAKRYDGLAGDLAGFPVIDLARDQRKSFVNLTPVMTTKGCPYSCDFCCVNAIYGSRMRHIPIPTVVESIRRSGRSTFLFLDDNIIGRKSYARELFQSLIPLNIRWVGQASISFADDAELMQLAARSGCYGLFVGLESVAPDTLSTMIKTRSPEHSFGSIMKMRDAGIIFHASVVFGFDTDDERVFDNTLEFLLKAKVHSASINILTPYPGTRLHARLEEEGRLLTKDWRKYNHGTVVFRPKQMTVESLEENHIRVRKEFYGLSSILRRLPNNMSDPLVYLGMNAALRSTMKADRRALAAKRATRAESGFRGVEADADPLP